MRERKQERRGERNKPNETKPKETRKEDQQRRETERKVVRLNVVKTRIRKMLFDQVSTYKTIPSMVNEEGLINLGYVSTLGAIKRLAELLNLGEGREEGDVKSVLEDLFSSSIIRRGTSSYLPATHRYESSLS